ncbi:class I SAM-dependent methyltransferase [Hymenobacter sp. BT491]|uniref:class I SAM-dependent methyltransferase n=1 Tax=Hymenobacter sp. BT491 TaxID=2766779 RepID=UPI001653726D|nr:class I SAM-dependent methyltransferase [Hymenobacter sp. BT491]MBC6988287.1 class I SAM-dependent methyltransferase [Hymenobacter sp. BT491]
MKNFLKKAVDKLKYKDVIPYAPEKSYTPEKMLDIVSAWAGHEKVILDIIKRFDLEQNSCLEFGVEFGYSAVIFSNYFKKVVGVDIFVGDIHTNHKGDHYEETKDRLSKYENIELIKMDYKEWLKKDDNFYDLIHVDIVHTYEDTYKCGLWSAQHSKCAIFHDTESFPEVKKAVYDIAKKTGKKFYNYPEYYGLGIIV